MDFLVEISVTLPTDMPEEFRDRMVAAERIRGAELADEGFIRAIWRVPGQFANRAIWSAPDATVLHQAISSLPLWKYCDVKVTSLAHHELGPLCGGIPAGLV